MQQLATSRPSVDGGEDETESQVSVETLVSWVEDAEETTDNARKLSERDRDYYDHKQLTAAEKKTLRDRGQPDVIINRIKPKVDFLLGFEASNRTDPRAFPRTPQDEGASEACTDALRFTGDKTEANKKFSFVWENMLIEGFGGVELVVEQAKPRPGQNSEPDTEIKLVEWSWDRLFYDPHSRKLDFSDARYLGGYVWMDYEDAKARWPDAADVLDLTANEASFTVTYDDRPRWQTWVSGKTRKRVRIVQMYYREGHQWMYCVFCKAGKLDSYPVPFVDQDGMSFCPLILQSAYVDRQNNRYGAVRTLIDVQDEINKRRSKALHRITMRQTVTEHGAVDDVDAAKIEMTKPDGMVVVNPGFRFEMLQAGEQLQAELALLQEAKNEIENMGPNASMLGKDGDAPSGKAIQLNRQSGQTEISMLLDRHKGLKARTYRHMWDLIRQYKTQQWWIRVTDNEENVKFVGINKPVTMREELSKKLEAQKVPPEQAQQMIGQLEADPMRGPMLDETVRIENQPTEMWMDITIEEVPDTANVQEEQFHALVQLAPAVTFPPRVYLMASNLRNKKELISELEGGENPEEKEAKQEAMKLEFSKARAELDKMIADIGKTKAETHKIMIEADMAQMPQGVVHVPQVAEAPPPMMPQQMGPPMGGPPMPPPQMMPPPEMQGAPPPFVQSAPPPGDPTGADVMPMPPPGL